MMDFLMRIEANDYVWIVLDPEPSSMLVDICFPITLEDMVSMADIRQWRGRHMTLHLSRSAAQTDGWERLRQAGSRKEEVRA